MSGSPQEQKRVWVDKVLGVRFTTDAPEGAAAPVPFVKRWQPVKEAWTEAIYIAEQQLATLGKLLRASPDPRLRQIAEVGLGAITAGHKVAVMAAVREVAAATIDPAQALPKALPKALKAVQGFRTHIETDARVAACDQNPFGPTVTLRATLGQALAQMESVLQRG